MSRITAYRRTIALERYALTPVSEEAKRQGWTEAVVQIHLPPGMATMPGYGLLQRFVYQGQVYTVAEALALGLATIVEGDQP